MGAQLNIKSEEAYALASELAQQSGTSLTQVVLDALRIHAKQQSKERRFRNAMALCEDIASRMSPETLAFDIDKELYDPETGLPK